MCAIVDANVVHEVFSSNPCPAGKKFFEWVEKGGSGRLVEGRSPRLMAGGKLLEELESGSPGFRDWATGAINSGIMRIVNRGRLDARTEELREDQRLKSDDPHVIALAQLSSARLLYTNDEDLQNDFRNKNLVNNPSGKIYSTEPENNPNKEFRATHKKLLGRNDLCRVE